MQAPDSAHVHLEDSIVSCGYRTGAHASKPFLHCMGFVEAENTTIVASTYDSASRLIKTSP